MLMNLLAHGDTWLVLGDGQRLPASRFVLATRSGFFLRLFEDCGVKRGPDGRVEVRTTFPFPEETVRAAIEWLHGPDGCSGFVDIDTYGIVHEVLDFLDVDAVPRLPDSPTWDQKRALLLTATRLPGTKILSSRLSLTVATEIWDTARDSRMAAWLDFVDRTMDGLEAAAAAAEDEDAKRGVERVVKAVLGQFISDLRKVLWDKARWPAALDVAADARERRCKTLRLAFPGFLVRAIAEELAPGPGWDFPRTPEPSNVLRLVDDALADGVCMSSVSVMDRDSCRFGFASDDAWLIVGVVAAAFDHRSPVTLRTCESDIVLHVRDDQISITADTAVRGMVYDSRSHRAYSVSGTRPVIELADINIVNDEGDFAVAVLVDF